MGAIVSKSSEMEDEGGQDMQGSAVTAAQAKIRHELLQEHFQRRTEQKDEMGDTGGVTSPEWFPAGVSPSYFPWERKGEELEGMSAAEEVQQYQMSWMDSQTLSTRELHRAAVGINRSLPRHEERKTKNPIERASSPHTLPSSSLLRRDDYFSIQSSLEPSHQPLAHRQASSPQLRPSSFRRISSSQHTTSLSLDNTSSVLLPSINEMSPSPHVTPSSPNPSTSLKVPPTLLLNASEVAQDETKINVIQAKEVPIVLSNDSILLGSEERRGWSDGAAEQQSKQSVVQRWVVEPRLLGRPKRNESRRIIPALQDVAPHAAKPRPSTLYPHLSKAHSSTQSLPTPHRSKPLHSPVRGLHRSLTVNAFPPKTAQTSKTPTHQEMTYAGPGIMKAETTTPEGAWPLQRKRGAAARTPCLEEPSTVAGKGLATVLTKNATLSLHPPKEGVEPEATPNLPRSPQTPRVQRVLAKNATPSLHLPKEGVEPEATPNLPRSPQACRVQRVLAKNATPSLHPPKEGVEPEATPNLPRSPQAPRVQRVLTKNTTHPTQHVLNVAGPSPKEGAEPGSKLPATPPLQTSREEHQHQRCMPRFTGPNDDKGGMETGEKMAAEAVPHPPSSPQTPGVEHRHRRPSPHTIKPLTGPFTPRQGKQGMGTGERMAEAMPPPPSSPQASRLPYSLHTLTAHQFSAGPSPQNQDLQEEGKEKTRLERIQESTHSTMATSDATKKRIKSKEREIKSLSVRGASSNSRRGSIGDAVVVGNDRRYSQERLVSLTVEANRSSASKLHRASIDSQRGSRVWSPDSSLIVVGNDRRYSQVSYDSLAAETASSESRRGSQSDAVSRVWTPDSSLGNDRRYSQERPVSFESLAVEANLMSTLRREVASASRPEKRVVNEEDEGKEKREGLEEDECSGGTKEEMEGDDEEQEEGELEGEEEENEDEEEEKEDEEEEAGQDGGSLVQLLYSEVAEGLERSSDTVEDTEAKKAGKLPPAILQKIHTVMVLENMQNRAPPAEYGEHSILLAPPDREALVKAGEFRGDVVNQLQHLTTSLKLDYYQFIEDYDQTFFYTAQQMEAGLKDYVPQIVLLISSTVPKHDVLRSTVLPNVLACVYDYHHETPQGLLDKIQSLLDGYKPKAKAKYLGIVCKGGPGHFYLIKNMPVTPAKIRNNVALLEFWQKAGSFMSKLIPEQSFIHLMESNVAGNRQGEKLLTDLEYSMFSHRVKIQSPLEMSPSGRKMLGLYFNTAQHKLWKANRYSKVKLYK